MIRSFGLIYFVLSAQTNTETVFTGIQESDMAVQYAPTKLRVPPGFQNLLEGLAREVLREQPDDIVVFAAQYFKNQLVIREETGRDDAKQGDQLERLAKGEEVDIDLNDPKTNEAAVKIQASFRGHKTREELKHKKEEEEAAVKIQSSFRGMKAREQVKEIRESRSQEAINEKAAAKVEGEKLDEGVAQQPQSDAAEKPVEKTGDIDIDLNDQEVQDAALKIQASFRGHKAREEVKSIRSQSSHSGPAETEVDKQGDDTQAAQEAATPAEGKDAVDIDLNDPEVQEAALKIQSSFRGHKARESVKSMRSNEGSEKGATPSGEAEAEVANEAIAEQQAADDNEAKPSGEEIDIDLTDPEVGKAASLIQASFRGQKVRQELKQDLSTGTPGGNEEEAEVPAQGGEEKVEEPPRQEAVEEETEKQEEKEQGGTEPEGQEQKGEEAESEKQEDTKSVDKDAADAEVTAETKGDD